MRCCGAEAAHVSASVFAIVIGVVVFVVFYGGILALAVRWSRALLRRKSEALSQQLQRLGAVAVGPAHVAGLYAGVEAHFTLGGRPLTTVVRYVSRSLVRASIRVRTGPLPAVRFFPERGLDRLGKALGVSREVQTGDAAFDGACYVDSADSDEVVLRLLAAPSAREAITALLRAGFRVETSERGVEVFLVQFASKRLADVNLQPAAEGLLELAQHLPRFDSGELKPTRGPVATALVVWGLVVLMVGAITVTSLAGAVEGQSVDTLFDAVFYVVAGGGAWLLLMVALVFFLRGTSRAGRVLSAVGLMSLLLVPPLVGAGLQWVNRALDASPGTPQAVTVWNKGTRAHHVVYVQSWTSRYGKTEVPVTRAVYDQLQPGSPFTVQVHPGRLGVAWMERVRQL